MKGKKQNMEGKKHNSGTRRDCIKWGDMKTDQTRGETL